MNIVENNNFFYIENRFKERISENFYKNNTTYVEEKEHIIINENNNIKVFIENGECFKNYKIKYDESDDYFFPYNIVINNKKYTIDILDNKFSILTNHYIFNNNKIEKQSLFIEVNPFSSILENIINHFNFKNYKIKPKDFYLVINNYYYVANLNNTYYIKHYKKDIEIELENFKGVDTTTISVLCDGNDIYTFNNDYEIIRTDFLNTNKFLYRVKNTLLIFLDFFVINNYTDVSVSIDDKVLTNHHILKFKTLS